jgi:SAM-dependent methyltransferase
LSQGLFSSADIDTGSRFLLKVLSQKWDEDIREGGTLPVTVLDAGCGTGVLGICAARALAGIPELQVRAQDRDELARSFTEYNARRNGVPASVLSAHTEPLLDAAPAWDLILSNIPAKTGEPVLLDFIARSAGLLNERGSVIVVVVNTLSGLFRSRIRELALPLLRHEKGTDHTVLVYGAGISPSLALNSARKDTGDDFFRRWPAYFRCAGEHEIKDIRYHIDASHGAADFDTPSGAVTAAARLTTRLSPAIGNCCALQAILVHEPDQGHFPVWLLKYLERNVPHGFPRGFRRMVLSGRNILALEASRHNLGGAAQVVPAVDIALSRDALLAAAGMPYGAVFLFPSIVPRTSRLGACWEGLEALLKPGGIAVVALPSAPAERFDREKPRGIVRLGDHKRHGFRALGYEKR